MQTQYIGGSTAAYDLEKFNTKQRMRVKKPTLVVAKPTKSTRARAQFTATLKLLTALALVAAAVVTMLYSRAMLTELTQQVSKSTNELAELKSEGTRLSAELEAKVSLRNVEEYASQKLGMASMGKHQIVYMDLSEGDKIELTNESPKQTLVDRVRVAISNVQEYIPQE